MALAVTFQEVAVEFAPLFGLSFSIFALKGFRLSHSAKWVGGFWTHLLDIVLSSLVGAFLIVSGCIIIMSVKPDLGEIAIIGIAVFLSVGGVTLVDNLVFKYFGVRMFETKPIKGELRRHDGGEDE